MERRPEWRGRKLRPIPPGSHVDVQIAGIGDGHLAFNEPHSGLFSRRRVAALSAATREANARLFPSLDAVPKRCITQGLGTILDSRLLVVVASGKRKARAPSNARSMAR